MRAVKSGALIAQNVAAGRKIRDKSARRRRCDIENRLLGDLLANVLARIVEFIHRKALLAPREEHRYGPHIAQKVLIAL